jgi:hypothetical protein
VRAQKGPACDLQRSPRLPNAQPRWAMPQPLSYYHLFITCFGPYRAIRPSRAGLVAGGSSLVFGFSSTYSLNSRTLIIGLIRYSHCLSLTLDIKTPLTWPCKKAIEAPRFPFSLVCPLHFTPQRVRIPPGLRARSLISSNLPYSNLQ